MESRFEGIERLWRVIDRLRGEKGCPWDRKQTPETVKTYVVEEAHEVDAAIRSGQPEEVKEELGDLLFMVLFMIHLYDENGFFGLQDVCSSVEEKMIRRHPHVFGGMQVSSAEEVKDNWEKIKKEEKNANSGKIPRTLPALIRAYRLLSRNMISPPVIDQGKELIGSLGRRFVSLSICSDAEFSRHFGDLMIDLCQLARLKGFRPEDLLQSRLDERERG